MEDDKDGFFISTRKKSEEGMKVDNEAGGHASGSVIGHCLLVLGRLRTGMLGPDAPKGILGSTLRDLFEAAGSTQKDKVQGRAVDVLPQKVLYDVNFEGMDVATADSRILEDIASPPFVSPLREENAPILSGSDVEKNYSAVQPEVSTESKMTTSSAKVPTKDKGKA
ncbi:hypothetical protein E2562_001834 [Oryza meyeriana var. granulata]|uniref:Uncharacterized protein n=1 Tax=Oryza meyeriana var. granulata TaxID=110450 RepID=A0A6G1CDG6_9ORYZ|nr:hypothetical protein E2562_001834 [Oryza meyeriana var. granulata]